MRILAALTLCFALLVPIQAADGAAHHRKHKHAKRCHKAKKRRGHHRARCAHKRKRRSVKHPASKGKLPALSSPTAPAGSPLIGPVPGPPLGRYLSVSSREFSLSLSRPALAAGSVNIELRNVGEDPHDLVLSPDDGSHTPLASWGETASGGVVTKPLTLPAGRYYLFCSLPNHEALGMSAHLSVR